MQNEFPYHTREDNGKASDTPLIQVRASGQSLYTDYMGGDIGETIVRTKSPRSSQNSDCRRLVYKRARAVAVFDFDEMRSLDYRHFDGAALSDYIRAYRPDYVLILRDDVSCLSQTGNGAIS